MNRKEAEDLVKEQNEARQKNYIDGGEESMCVSDLIRALQSLPAEMRLADTGATWLEMVPVCERGQRVYEREDGTKYLSTEVVDWRIHIHGA